MRSTEVPESAAADQPPWRRLLRPGRLPAGASGPSLRAGLGLVACAVAVTLPDALATDARLALLAFGTAVVLWSTTALPAGWVALAAAAGLTLVGGVEQDELYGALGSDVVWLMVGAFVLGGAVRAVGLAGRLTTVLGRRVRTVGGAMWAVTAVIVPMSLLIPSTSGRAAVALPLHRALTRAVDDRSATRAVSLLIPVVVLVSTVSTLVGAGSHLIADDLLRSATGESIGFGRWLLWGVPFGVVASAASCWVIARMHLAPELRRRPLRLPQDGPRPLSGAESRTLAVALGMVTLWASGPVHGLDVAFVAVIGAVLLTAPGVGVLGWRQGLESVSWNLVVFVAAALVLGEALIDTGAAAWLVGHLTALPLAGAPTLVCLVALTGLTLTSHLYLTSHAARTVALVPPLLSMATTFDLDPTAVVFIGVVGIDYCLTLAVSSKALLLYAELDEPTFDPGDLLRLSAVLMPLHLGLVVAFYLVWWQPTGLAL